jgi:hypothetical protein
MSTTTHVPAARGVRPREPAPGLTVPLLGGGTYQLSEQRPNLFTMVAFFRGLHCPVCRAQLRELRAPPRRARGARHRGHRRQRRDARANEFGRQRVEAPAPPAAYGLTDEQMRAWGPFVSHGINEGEPAVFNEPGLFLISPTTPSTTRRSSRCRSDDPGSAICSTARLLDHSRLPRTRRSPRT